MNTKLIALVAAVIVLVGGGVFLVSRDGSRGSQNSESNSQTGEESKQAQAGEKTETIGNLQTLRSGGKAQECDMSYSDDSGSGTGKMYTDGKGRGRISLDLTTSRGNSGQSNTLVTEEKVYSWTTTDGGSFGFVFDASTVQAGATGSPTTSSSQTAGKDFNLTCSSWNVDGSVLTVPSDVNFSQLPSGQ